MYSDAARQRKRDVLGEMMRDMAGMRVYRTLVEEAPHIVLVLSPDIQCRVLYANKALTRILHVKTEAVLGRPLWSCIHEDDRTRFAQSLTAVILGTCATATQAIRGRVQTPPGENCYVNLQLRLNAGTQGIQCWMWA